MSAPNTARKLATAFKPTPNQIRAAENLLVAMSHEQVVRPIVEGYETEILVKHQFKIAERWICLGVSAGVVLDRKRSHLLSKVDADVFYRECQEAREAVGLTVNDPEACPLLVAENLRLQAENALLITWAETPGMESFAATHTLSLAQREKSVGLVLKLLAPFVANGQDILNRITA
jgi:hypothetical protein